MTSLHPLFSRHGHTSQLCHRRGRIPLPHSAMNPWEIYTQLSLRNSSKPTNARGKPTSWPLLQAFAARAIPQGPDCASTPLPRHCGRLRGMGKTQGVQQRRGSTPADMCGGLCLTNTYREPCRGSGGAAQPWPRGERSHCWEKHLAKQH